MSRLSRKLTPRRLKIAFYLTLTAILLLVGYRIYLSFFEQTYHAVHAEQIERIQSRADDGLHFAVVGNINNSVGLFERSKYGAFPEYHTSADNLDFISAAELA